MSRAAAVITVAGLLLVLAAANGTIFKRQQLVDDGRPVLLELRPRDPRSLFQGDYMALRYSGRAFPPAGTRDALPARGTLVVRLDAEGVAGFARLDDGTALAGDEARLRFKQVDRNGTVKLGAETFFFQEGHAGVYNAARYGILHVDAAGNSVLVGLADEQRRRIDPDSARNP